MLWQNLVTLGTDMSEQTCTAEALNDLRQRYLRGEEWSRQELKDAIYTMIGQRIADVQASVPTAKKVKAAAVSLDELLPTAAPVEVPKATEQSVPTKAVTDKNVISKPSPSQIPKKPTDGFF